MELNVLKDALQKGKIEKVKDEIEYFRIKDPFKNVQRGTVITKDRIIPGYPHIKRIFTLENGIKRNITSPIIYAEEKIDGYNVRIISIKGKIFAFSRGGFLDAFVTEKARDMKLEKFFNDFPEYVICGEMIGNTPHTDPTDQFDVKLYIFDIYDGTKFLGCDERYKIVSNYGLASVPRIGKFNSSDFTALRKAIVALNKGRKEGMVLKSADRNEIIKYVTAYSDIQDIAGASDRLFDMPIGFYYQRILRSAMFINDFALGREEYAKLLGSAFYSGLEDSINKIKKGEDISAEFEIFIKDEKVWKDVMRHSTKDAKIEQIFRREEKGKIRIRFRRIYRNTTKTLTSYSNGKAIED